VDHQSYYQLQQESIAQKKIIFYKAHGHKIPRKRSPLGLGLVPRTRTGNMPEKVDAQPFYFSILVDLSPAIALCRSDCVFRLSDVFAHVPVTVT
jgi:hypothetical protein